VIISAIEKIPPPGVALPGHPERADLFRPGPPGYESVRCPVNPAYREAR
jgi:hypothetical protein